LLNALSVDAANSGGAPRHGIDDGESQISYARVGFAGGTSQPIDFNDQFAHPACIHGLKK